ncbi:cadherin domain-containing protein, partial [Rubripirellula amarantea]|nr:cadherin domain-containing protein [Rubripirellula amarantea]
ATRFDSAGNLVGSEFEVSTEQVNYQQLLPSVAQLENGEIVFAWEKTSNYSEATETNDKVFRRHFDVDGTPETNILETETFAQVGNLRPHVTALAGGGHITLWHNYGFEATGGTSAGIIGQLYDEAGEPVGAQFVLNAETASSELYPAVEALPGGGFVAAWTNTNDGSSYGVIVARYDSSGTLVGSEQLVNTVTNSVQQVPEIAVADDGSFVVTYMSAQYDSVANSYEQLFQRFDAAGNKVGVETIANQNVSGVQYYGEVSYGTDGKFLVTWGDSTGDSSGWGVKARLFNADGTPADDEFLVNTSEYSSQLHPTVVTLSNGKYAVAWQSNSTDGSRYGVYAQLLDADGTLSGSEFLVSQITAGDQDSVKLQSLSTGGFAATWIGSGDGQSAAIWGRTFDATGTATSDEFRVSDTSDGWNVSPSLTERADGSLIFAWTTYDREMGSVVQQRIYTQGLVDSTETGAIIGKFTTTDPDAADTHTYEIVAADTNDFEIVEGHLKVKAGAAFDAENDPPRSVTIRTTDSVGNTFDKVFVINPQPTNYGPTDLVLPTNTVTENADTGTVVGTVTVSDPNPADTHTFELTDDAGGAFQIDANTGVISILDSTLLDYESDATPDLTVRVTDSGSLVYSETFAINLTNELDANQIVPGPQSVAEDEVLTFNVANGNAVTIGDDGVADDWFQVSLSVNDGVLTLSQTTGLTFVEGSQDSGSMVINGTESDINAALEGMTFTPDANFHGAVMLDVTTALAVDLEAHYTFTGSNANDQSAGTSYDGTLSGNAKIVVDGTRGEVLSLDGTADYVEVASRFGQPANVTLAAWVNLDSLGSLGSDIINISNNLILRVDDTNGLIAQFYNGSSFRKIVSNISLEGTGWRHVAFTFDDAGNEQNLYLDGVLVASNTLDESINHGTADVTRIGADDTNASWDFGGLIDDARIYTRALSA